MNLNFQPHFSTLLQKMRWLLDLTARVLTSVDMELYVLCRFFFSSHMFWVDTNFVLHLIFDIMMLFSSSFVNLLWVTLLNTYVFLQSKNTLVVWYTSWRISLYKLQTSRELSPNLSLPDNAKNVKPVDIVLFKTLCIQIKYLLCSKINGSSARGHW